MIKTVLFVCMLPLPSYMFPMLKRAVSVSNLNTPGGKKNALGPIHKDWAASIVIGNPYCPFIVRKEFITTIKKEKPEVQGNKTICYSAFLIDGTKIVCLDLFSGPKARRKVAYLYKKVEQSIDQGDVPRENEEEFLTFEIHPHNFDVLESYYQKIHDKEAK